jgi:hypothetical protein
MMTLRLPSLGSSTKRFLLLLATTTILATASFVRAASSTQIVFDELSLWHSPGNSGVGYESFEPLRVRRESAEYFFRTDARNAYSGIRYGEIRLSGKQGGILYLPRDLDLRDAIALKVFVRKSNPNSRLDIFLFQSSTAGASFSEGYTGLQTKSDGKWSEVTIPLANIKFQQVHRDQPANPTFREPDLFLTWHKAQPGKLWGIRLGLKSGRKGDQLFVDRLVVLRNQAPSARVLKGHLEPAIPGARVVVTTDKGTATAVVDGAGDFTVGLPSDSSKAEIVAETDKMVFTPVQGRFLELGEYLPPLLIKTSENGITRPPKSGNMNSSRYYYGDRRGSRVEPLLNFGVAVNESNKQLVLADLASNGLGYIDQDHPVDGSPDAYRVLWLGECHQMGVHIAQADNWWNQAEGLLAVTTQKPVEIFSASFHYSPFVNAWPAFIHLTKKFHPNLVILPLIDPEVLNLNIEEYVMEWLSASKGHLPTHQFTMGPNGKIIHRPYDSDWEVYREQMPEQKKKEIRKKYFSWEYIREDRKTTPQWTRDNLSAIEGALGKFAKESHRLGTRVIVLYISDFHLHSNRDENGVRYVPKPFLDDMRAMTTRSGLEFVDLSQSIHRVMPGNDTDRIYYRGNGHWTPYGHYRAGKALASYLATQANQKNYRAGGGVPSR